MLGVMGTAGRKWAAINSPNKMTAAVSVSRIRSRTRCAVPSKIRTAAAARRIILKGTLVMVMLLKLYYS